MCCHPELRTKIGVLVVAVAALLVARSGLSGQQVTSKPITGLQQVRPLVPGTDPRQLGSDLERQNLKNRGADDQQSTSSFIQSLQGQDALVEVIVGRGRLITLKEPLAAPTGNIPALAVGDPTVLDFDLLPNSRMIRLLGKRVGTTDLSIVTADGKSLSFEVQVVYDMKLLRAQLKQIFPNAYLNVGQIYEHVVVEGQAQSTQEVTQIIQTISAYLTSAQVARTVQSKSTSSPEESAPTAPTPSGEDGEQNPETPADDTGALDEEKPDITATLPPPQIINLIQVPGGQQVMLQVRVAELNRTVMREIGADLYARDSNGNAFGTQIAGAIASLAGLDLGEPSTAFAIWPSTTVEVILRALRQNRVLNILAEPNLMAMHGQQASFLAGGEFPVPVPQASAGGISSTVTIEFKEFGVLLNFVPYIMHNGLIRLQVAPEVSTIDDAIGVQIQGTTVPGINTRRANTTVELRQGQTLALAGLLQIELEASTARLPGLGDLPYIGPFFSNTSNERVEKELIILVTPLLVDAMEECQVAPLPGSEIRDPDDFEFYFLNRIEGRAQPPTDYRATTAWDDPFHVKLRLYEKHNISGPSGFSK